MFSLKQHGPCGRRSERIAVVIRPADDGTILGSFKAPARGARCLAYDGRYLWIANRLDDELYLVDPETGWVLSILPSPGPYPGGVAWHDES